MASQSVDLARDAVLSSLLEKLIDHDVLTVEQVRALLNDALVKVRKASNRRDVVDRAELIVSRLSEGLPAQVVRAGSKRITVHIGPTVPEAHPRRKRALAPKAAEA